MSQKKTEMDFSGILKVAEKTTGLFFSYDANLTLRWTFLHIFSKHPNSQGFRHEAYLFTQVYKSVGKIIFDEQAGLNHATF